MWPEPEPEASTLALRRLMWWDAEARTLWEPGQWQQLVCWKTGDSAIPVTRHSDLTSLRKIAGHVLMGLGMYQLTRAVTHGVTYPGSSRGWTGRGWTVVQNRLFRFWAALIFALPVRAVSCSSSRPVLWAAGTRCVFGMGHTAGPTDLVSLSSLSVLPVSHHHEMGWTYRLLLSFLVKDLDKKIKEYKDCTSCAKSNQASVKPLVFLC